MAHGLGSLFRRLKGGKESEPELSAELGELPPGHVADSGAVVAGPGEVHCAEVSCRYRAEAICEYMDRRQLGCQTVWCREHTAVREGHTYCRRHAGVARALAKARIAEVEPPDLDQRAPSLAEWVANELDDHIQRLLTEIRGAQHTLTQASDPLSLLIHGVPRTRAWERRWTLSAQTGLIVRIVIRVQEENEDEIVALVGPEVVARVTPPWIQNRSRKPPFPPEVDADKRREFRESLMRAISEAVARRRPRVAV